MFFVISSKFRGIFTRYILCYKVRFPRLLGRDPVGKFNDPNRTRYQNEQQDPLELLRLTVHGPNEQVNRGVTLDTRTTQEDQDKVSILKKRAVVMKDRSFSSPDERRNALSKSLSFYLLHAVDGS